MRTPQKRPPIPVPPAKPPSAPVLAENKFDARVIAYLEEILPSLRTHIPRFFEGEQQELLEGKIEFQMIMWLTLGRIAEIFPSVTKDGDHLLDIKEPDAENFRIVLTSFQGIPPYSEHESRYWQQFSLRDPPVSYDFGDVFSPSCLFARKKTLIELYLGEEKSCRNKRFSRLLRLLNIPEDPTAPLKINRRAHWRRIVMPTGSCQRENGKSYFFDRFRRLHFAVRIEIIGDLYKLLPETFWVHDEKCPDGRSMPIPPIGELPLMNSHMYPRSSISIYTPLPIIILTDSIFLAHDRNDEGFFWTSWYGEAKTVQDVDWSMLTGQVVYYLLIRHSGLGMKAIYKMALAAYEQLKDVEKLDLRYISVEDIPGQVNKKIEILDSKTFLQRAENIIKVPPSASKQATANPKIRLRSAADPVVQETIEYLLYPAIPEKKTTLLCSDDLEEASWLSMSMAYAVATGKGLLKNGKPPKPQDGNQESKKPIKKRPRSYSRRWTVNGKPQKVLYLETRQDPALFEKNLEVLKKVHGTANSEFFAWEIIPADALSGNEWQSTIKEYLDAALKAKPEGVSVSLLVLDGYAMFAGSDRNKRLLQELLAWLRELNQVECATLLLYPDKKYRDKAGLLQSVMQVKNEEHGKSHVAVSVCMDRCCDIGEQGRQLPILLLDYGKRKPAWKTVARFRTKEEKYETIRQMALNKGLAGNPKSIKAIAAHFDLSRIRVHQILKDKEDAKPANL